MRISVTIIDTCRFSINKNRGNVIVIIFAISEGR